MYHIRNASQNLQSVRNLLVEEQVENEHTAAWCGNSQLYHMQRPLAVDLARVTQHASAIVR